VGGVQPMELSRYGAGMIVKHLDYQFLFSSIRIKGDSIEATLKITYNKKVLFIGKVELMDINKRWHLARHLSELVKNVNWNEILTILFTNVTNELLKYEPPTKLQDTSETKNHFWIYPFLADPYTLIFAAGGSGKSYLAMYFSMLVQNGINDYFDIPEPMNVLYLDWETSKEDMEGRFSRLANAKSNVESPFYRNMVFPLKYEFDNVLNDILQYDIKLIVIDSVVPALGGNINEAENVGEFFRMLKEFYKVNKTRTLILTHISKVDKRDENNKSPIGSVYFENYPRLVWELRHVSLKNKLNIELHPYKANVPFPSPLGFEFQFDNSVIFVKEFEAEVDNEFEKALLQYIGNSFEAKLKELKDFARKEFDINADELRRVLRKLTREGKIYQTTKGYYTLASNTQETAASKSNDDLPPF